MSSSRPNSYALRRQFARQHPCSGSHQHQPVFLTRVVVIRLTQKAQAGYPGSGRPNGQRARHHACPAGHGNATQRSEGRPLKKARYRPFRASADAARHGHQAAARVLNIDPKRICQ